MIPLWIDTDACHDDSIAVLLASALPYFNLVGISTTYGAVSLDYASRNASSLLAALQVTNVPVFPGEAKPALGKLPVQRGGSGLDGTGLLSLPQGPKQADHSAMGALAAALQQHAPQQLCVACLGPLTNIASFALNHPELVPLIDVITVSAGVGNSNLLADPHATNMVMHLIDIVTPPVEPGTPLPQVLIAESNPSVVISPYILDLIKRGPNLDKYTVFRQMMYELLAYYSDHITPEVCDPVAIIALLPQMLNADLGLSVADNGTVSVKDSEPMWRLVLKSIEELESSEL